MNSLRFKTNINCGGCIKTVTPILDSIKAIDKWEVNIESKDKELKVWGNTLDQAEIEEAVTTAGFNIELKKTSLLGRLFGS
ncbi:heavy-metal-associated domain-containing protein [Fulvivirgaceae bacterium BMA10]|uniref:Heavy-metal-associated domain-containing protein n=1 Tax=Splendidivirga corallicola TaxID=3051826 RepID=A0ABT8KI64_9BACT|nr:heavy-metal-associated domain-containing protein [Fulvivirgaceae bacterium BMA10]